MTVSVSILKMLLSTTACKQGMPNIDTLLLHSFFNTGSSVSNRIAVNETMQCYLKFPHQVKEELQNAARNIEIRLKSDQKLVIFFLKVLYIIFNKIICTYLILLGTHE